MHDSMTTTAFSLDGYRVSKNLGLVRGITVRSRSIVGNFGASIQSLFGGNITIYETLCEQAREQALEKMFAHARQLGANAVIGVRYDATELMPGITEVLCYGTAVQESSRRLEGNAASPRDLISGSRGARALILSAWRATLLRMSLPRYGGLAWCARAFSPGLSGIVFCSPQPRFRCHGAPSGAKGRHGGAGFPVPPQQGQPWSPPQTRRPGRWLWAAGNFFLRQVCSDRGVRIP